MLKLWGSFFFSKCSKFNVHSKTAIKNYKKFLNYQIIVFELVAVNSPLLQEHSQSVVNVLTSSPKISGLTKNDLFELNLARNDAEVG